MGETQIVDRIDRGRARSAWDVSASCNERYWNRSGRDERRAGLRACPQDQRRAVVAARVYASKLKPALAALRAMRTVKVRGWVARGVQARILLSVVDPLPPETMSEIFDVEGIIDLRPDSERTAKEYGFRNTVEFADACTRPILPEPTPVASPLLEQQPAISSMGLPPVTGQPPAEHVVAVLDDGVEWDHPYVSSGLWLNAAELNRPVCDGDGCGLVNDYIGWNFYANSPDPRPWNFWPHGTSVAGLVLAVARSAAAPTKVMPVRTDGPDSSLSLTKLASAIDYARAHGAGTIVIATVWSLKDSPDALGQQALADALQRASSDTLVVCAAGNSGLDIEEEEIEPARSGLGMPNVLTVLGAGTNFTVSNLASGHLNEVVVGPAGDDVKSIGTAKAMEIPFGSTSAATGIIGGVSAVMAAARGATNPAQRKQLLLQCRDPGAAGSNDLSKHLLNCNFLPAPPGP